MKRKVFGTVVAFALVCCARVHANIALATQSEFRVAYTMRSGVPGSGTGAGTTPFASSASGSVLVNTPTWTYQNWNIQYPAASASNTFTAPVGLGSAQFTLSFAIDSWGWQMSGPIVTTVTQSTLNNFQSEGFSTANISVQQMTGTWKLKGPVTEVGGSFSFLPTLQRIASVVPSTTWSSQIVFGCLQCRGARSFQRRSRRPIVQYRALAASTKRSGGRRPRTDVGGYAS